MRKFMRNSNNNSEKRKAKKKASPVTIFRSFVKFFLLVSTIHGLNHITFEKRHPLEAVLWITLVATAAYGSGVICSATLYRYQTNPTVISMERDRFFWNTTFPGGTICPNFRISEEKLDKYVRENSIENRTALKEFVESLSQATYTNFEKVIPYDGITSDMYFDALTKLQFDFNPVVSNSGSSYEKHELQQTITEIGICHTFNSQLAVYSSPGYWKSGKWKIVEKSQTFFVHPLDGEVFANIVNMSRAFSFYIHGPYETIDIASKGISEEDGHFLQVYVTGLTIFSSDRVRYLTPEQRKCRFYDESNLPHFPVYSFVLCRMECRIAVAKRLCGCLPHFYRKLSTDKVCDVSGLHCLAKHSDKLISLKEGCSCLPNCEEVNYAVEEIDSREWFLGSNIQWGFKEYPAMRLRRDIIFGFSDLLVYIGGIAGLFFGCSVLSFIEIIYYFTFRLFWFAVHYEKK